MLDKDEFLDNKFRFTILAAKRAKQIINGSKKKIEINAENPLTIALEEINQGVIDFDTLNKDFEEKVEQELNENESSAPEDEDEKEENPEEEKAIKN